VTIVSERSAALLLAPTRAVVSNPGGAAAHWTKQPPRHARGAGGWSLLSDTTSHGTALGMPARARKRVLTRVWPRTSYSPKVCIGCLLVDAGSELTLGSVERSRPAPTPSFAAALAVVAAWPLPPRCSDAGRPSRERPDFPYRTEAAGSLEWQPQE
jgi:hypothetical protein